MKDYNLCFKALPLTNLVPTYSAAERGEEPCGAERRYARLDKWNAVQAALILGIVLAPAVCAQGTISNNAMERSHWYTAPREYQIVDPRPIIKDFREGPTNAGRSPLPGAPGGGGVSGGPGGGALGGGPGSNDDVLPSGGLPIPGDGSQPAYRSDPTGMSSLPKSGFGGTNIPVGGLGPRGILPGVNQQVVGKIMNKNKYYKPPAVPAKAVAARGPAVNVPAKPSAPSVISYGNYSSSSPNTYGSGLNTATKVRGSLLHQK